MSATVQRSGQRFFGMAAVALLAWAGMVVHNLADLPISFLSPENMLPGLVWAALLLLWVAVPSARWPTALLLVWGITNLIGAVTTVLPLSVLPFEPEQSMRHYGFHLLYAATQVPLLRRTTSELISARAPARQPT